MCHSRVERGRASQNQRRTQVFIGLAYLRELTISRPRDPNLDNLIRSELWSECGSHKPGTCTYNKTSNYDCGEGTNKSGEAFVSPSYSLIMLPYHFALNRHPSLP